MFGAAPVSAVGAQENKGHALGVAWQFRICGMAARRDSGPAKKPASATRTAEPTTKPARKSAAVSAAQSAPRKKSPNRATLMRRVERAIAIELARIETLITDGATDHVQSEAERRARTLATLARTLKEVTRLRADAKEMTPADDDTVPRDLDEFRRELSRRLDLLVAEAAAAHPEPAERA
jgi:hypothetical protein